MVDDINKKREEWEKRDEEIKAKMKLKSDLRIAEVIQRAKVRLNLTNEKFTREQTRAIVALVSTPTIFEAASEAGIDERTLKRWFQDQSFRTAYKEVRRCCPSTISKRGTFCFASVPIWRCVSP